LSLDLDKVTLEMGNGMININVEKPKSQIAKMNEQIKLSNTGSYKTMVKFQMSLVNK